MPFAFLDEDEKIFFSEQPVLPDRVVGIVLPSLVDRRLARIIQDCWNDTAKRNLLSELFRDGGALGSLQTRAQIGFAIGMYDEEIFTDLKLIVKIRNAFAHIPGARDFNAQPIRDYTRNFRLPDLYPKEGGPAYPEEGPPTPDKQIIEHLMRSSGLKDIEPPRHRFLRTTEIVLTWLSIKSGHFDSLSPSLRHF